jgi:hypothetical protein
MNIKHVSISALAAALVAAGPIAAAIDIGGTGGSVNVGASTSLEVGGNTGGNFAGSGSSDATVGTGGSAAGSGYTGVRRSSRAGAGATMEGHTSSGSSAGTGASAAGSVDANVGPTKKRHARTNRGKSDECPPGLEMQNRC